MAEGHGGRRTPRDPAAVSNPRSGQRTDGGAGSKTQPLRVPTGGGYGEARALTEQQQAAPLPVADGQGVPSGGGAAGGAGVPAPLSPELGAPTNRPGESVMAGAVPPNQPPDTQAELQALYNLYPSPWIGKLLRD